MSKNSQRLETGRALRRKYPSGVPFKSRAITALQRHEAPRAGLLDAYPALTGFVRGRLPKRRERRVFWDSSKRGTYRKGAKHD